MCKLPKFAAVPRKPVIGDLIRFDGAGDLVRLVSGLEPEKETANANVPSPWWANRIDGIEYRHNGLITTVPTKVCPVKRQRTTNRPITVEGTCYQTVIHLDTASVALIVAYKR